MLEYVNIVDFLVESSSLAILKNILLIALKKLPLHSKNLFTPEKFKFCGVLELNQGSNNNSNPLINK